MEATDLNWYALYVRSRHEFIAESELRRKGLEAYLPAIKKLRQWKDRKKYIELPLFPGYIFVYAQPNPEQYLNILKTRGVVNIVSSEAGRPTPVAPEEINSLRMLIESGEEIDIYPHLKEGSRVRVKRGSLKGAEGVLEKRDEKYMLMINIDILGRSVSVKIYADDVEAA